jgi:hypothetical protein
MEDKIIDYPSFDGRFPKGTTHLLIGASGSGKTYRMCDILKYKSTLIKGGEDIQNVIFCYADWQPAYSKLKEQGLVTKWVNKMPTNQEFIDLVSPYQMKGGSIVVVDDFMTDINKELMKIVLNSSRHFNTSTFILFQSLFPPDNKIARQISLNTKFLHIFKNPRDNYQFTQLARQLRPTSFKWLVNVYHKITQEPYSCLLVDLMQDTDEKLRFRSHYLPTEGPTRVWFERNTL